MKTPILVACALAVAASLGACSGGAPPDPLLAWDNGAGSSSSGAVGGADGGAGSSSGGSGSGGSSSGGSGGGSSSGGSSGGSGGGSSSGGSSSGGGTSTLPCDVASLFAAHCTSCHSNPPQNGSLSSLVTYSDLMATSKEDSTKNEAQLSLSRMQNAASPMPPASVNDPATAAQIAILQTWINGGAKQGSCADAGAPPPGGVFQGQPPYQAPGGGGSSHNAGRDCLGCHNGQGDPNLFTIGGTIFDASNNPVAGAEIRLVDSSNKGFSVYSDSNGNFNSSASWGSPAHIGARNASSTSNMVSTLTYGGCNKCHCTGTGCTTTPIHLP